MRSASLLAGWLPVTVAASETPSDGSAYRFANRDEPSPS